MADNYLEKHYEEYEARKHQDKCSYRLEDPEIDLVSADLGSDLLEQRLKDHAEHNVDKVQDA